MAADSPLNWFKDSFENALPLAEWLPTYSRSWLRGDLIAGLTVSAAVIPEALAYSSLANVPAQMGLYAALFAVFVFVFFTTSRQVIAGPTSTLAILLAASVGAIASGTGANYLSLVVITTTLVGLVGVVSWLLRLGFLVNFISGSVITGFASGAGLYIISSQLGELLGISGVSGLFFERLWGTVTSLSQLNPTTAVVGLTSLVLLLLGERYLPRAPTALLVVLLSVAVSTVLDLSSRGVAVVGPIQGGLPSFVVPTIPDTSVLSALVPVALALFALSYVQGIGAEETFARRHDYRIDPNQELLATGLGNLVAGLFGGIVVGGSLSRSALNDAVGGKTQLVSLVVGLVLLVVLVLFTGLFTVLPEATLAAIIIVAVLRIVDVAGVRRLWNISASEFAIASAALLGVLTFGMLWGVFIGVGLSLAFTIARASNPKTEELARTSGTDHFVNKNRHPDAVPEPGVLIYRVDAVLFFANTKPVRHDLLTRVRESETPIELVVFDLFSSPMADLASAEMLIDLCQSLDDSGVELRLAGVNSQVRRLLVDAGVEQQFGPIQEDEAIASVIDRWKGEQSNK
ncbi:SulP family inorganic anion transporter [Haloferax sp. DFSO60]|uniref:SulP family inorganic anion transporter n=1 Tax=Haloferax sp. DFSO60 TaxID=3388652 RepID=UPI00397B8414